MDGYAAEHGPRTPSSCDAAESVVRRPAATSRPPHASRDRQPELLLPFPLPPSLQLLRLVDPCAVPRTRIRQIGLFLGSCVVILAATSCLSSEHLPRGIVLENVGMHAGSLSQQPGSMEEMDGPRRLGSVVKHLDNELARGHASLQDLRCGLVPVPSCLSSPTS
eukprot:1251281-Rhodomonas_salina.1